MPATHPTPYPEVNAVLAVLLAEVRVALGERFAGMYLYGSLASGDFDPHSSDIDFVVVTEGEVPAAVLPELEAMHARIASSGLRWAPKLEGAYIPRRALRRFEPDEAPCPYINEGVFQVGCLGPSWVIQRHIIREQGVVVAGPDPRTLIDPIPPDDLRRDVLGVLRGWWAEQLADPARLRTREYQAFAVLTMCRALYTLQHGSVISKPAAARWARDTLDGRWALLIERALAWRGDTRPDDASLSGTLDFIRHALERAEDFGQPRPPRNPATERRG